MNKIKFNDLVTYTKVDPKLPKDQLIQFPDGHQMIVNSNRVLSLMNSSGVEEIEQYSIYELEVKYD